VVEYCAQGDLLNFLRKVQSVTTHWHTLFWPHLSHLSIYLSISVFYLSISLYIYVYLSTYVYLPTYIYLYLSIYLYIYFYLSTYPYLSIFMSIYLPISIYPCLSTYLYLSISMSVYIYVYLPMFIHLSIPIYLSAYVPTCTYLYVYIYVYLPTCIYLSIYIYTHIYIYTYLIYFSAHLLFLPAISPTPCYRILLEQLISKSSDQEIPSLLSWTVKVQKLAHKNSEPGPFWTMSVGLQFTLSQPVSLKFSVTLLSPNLSLRLQSGLIPRCFPTKMLHRFAWQCVLTCSVHLILLGLLSLRTLCNCEEPHAVFFVLILLLIFSSKIPSSPVP
jgi:hypothetical protein